MKERSPLKVSLPRLLPSLAAIRESAELVDDCLAQVFACTVGQKPSKAPFYLNDTSEVAHLLSRLADLGAPPPPPLPPSLMPGVQRPRRMQVDASS